MTETPELEILPLGDKPGRRDAFALFRQAMLGIGDISHASVNAETSYLGSGDPLGGFVAGELRATVNGYAAAVALPGGRKVSHLSVTHVGVSPVATRQGIARRLLTEQLRRARSQGYVTAGLRASDSRIYGRYGYGIASWSVRHEVDTSRTSLSVPVRHDGVRIVDAVASFPLFRDIAEREPAPRAATLSRWDAWWSIQQFRAEHSQALHHAVVFGPPGAELGYLRFHIDPTGNWFTSPARTAIIDDLVAHDAETWRALVGHILAKDILHRVVLTSRPVDDPLPLLLDNPRALDVSGLRDESWIRALDLGELLAARDYGGRQPVVIEVADDIFPENAGLWSIGSDGVGRSSLPPHARLSIATLTSIVFGAQTPSALVAAGQIALASPETADLLDIVFATAQRPHSGISF